MNVSVKAASLNHFINEVAHSFTESFLALNALRALRDSARAKSDIFAKHLVAHDEWYRAAFDSLYVRIGRVVDTSNDSFTLPHLIDRLRKEWHSDATKLKAVDAVAQSFADAQLDAAGRLKRWRNKAIAHRTEKTTDVSFYEANKVSVDEVEACLRTLQSLFNELSYLAIETMHDCSDASPQLEIEIKSLFGVAE
jgi:hypothetical protein